ncbi:uncharacterized protein LOC108220213 isoform X3 [Daucus carota subsp. sativus]|uniref:uncharacterized protein LOC108220213 isoform X3 n=1 Tax=Daucus carota subsp. sativus TaxID=79200 RepID=UPI003082D2B4
MAIDIQTIERRYIVSCHQKGIPPNKSILFALFKVGEDVYVYRNFMQGLFPVRFRTLFSEKFLLILRTCVWLRSRKAIMRFVTL